MIERPSSRSTAEPSTFMATSQVPLPMPSSEQPDDDRRDAHRIAEPAVASPAAAIKRHHARPCARRPSRRDDHAGQRHRDQRADRDRQQHEPELRGVSSSASRTCGIRDAQLANAKPLRMKTA